MNFYKGASLYKRAESVLYKRSLLLSYSNKFSFNDNNKYIHIQSNNSINVAKNNQIESLNNIFKQQLRFRTFVRKSSPALKKVLERWKRREQLLGIPPPKLPKDTRQETRTFYIKDGLKIYKPLTPGTRHRKHLCFSHLYNGPAMRRLSFREVSTAGRSKKDGRITVRHRGGGHKRRVRIIAFKREYPGQLQIVRLEYDPNRNADLALCRSLQTNEFCYIINLDGMEPGQVITNYRNTDVRNASKTVLIKSGNCLTIRDIPEGTRICMIGASKYGIAEFCRAAGAFAVLAHHDTEKGLAHIKMASGELRMVSEEGFATVGRIGNLNAHLQSDGKAGVRRRKGWRPSVRGIAMSAYDHPIGGGGKSKGKKQGQSPWGKQIRGKKTVSKKRKNPLILITKQQLRSKH